MSPGSFAACLPASAPTAGVHAQPLGPTRPRARRPLPPPPAWPTRASSRRRWRRWQRPSRRRARQWAARAGAARRSAPAPAPTPRRRRRAPRRARRTQCREAPPAPRRGLRRVGTVRQPQSHSYMSLRRRPRTGQKSRLAGALCTQCRSVRYSTRNTYMYMYCTPLDHNGNIAYRSGFDFAARSIRIP
jgi:hypothetical protein